MNKIEINKEAKEVLDRIKDKIKCDDSTAILTMNEIMKMSVNRRNF